MWLIAKYRTAALFLSCHPSLPPEPSTTTDTQKAQHCCAPSLLPVSLPALAAHCSNQHHRGHPAAGNTETGIAQCDLHKTSPLIPLSFTCSPARSQHHSSKHNCSQEHAPPGVSALPAVVFLHQCCMHRLLAIPFIPCCVPRKALLPAARSPGIESICRRAARAPQLPNKLLGCTATRGSSASESTSGPAADHSAF